MTQRFERNARPETDQLADEKGLLLFRVIRGPHGDALSFCRFSCREAGAVNVGIRISQEGPGRGTVALPAVKVATPYHLILAKGDWSMPLFSYRRVIVWANPAKTAAGNLGESATRLMNAKTIAK